MEDFKNEMMRDDGVAVIDRSRKYENIVYVALWLLVFLLPFCNELMRVESGASFSWNNIARWFTGMIPYMATFLVNNYLLVPAYMQKGKGFAYVSLSLVLIAVFFVYQLFIYDCRFPLGISYRFLGVPMPVIMNTVMLLMMFAVNITVIVVFDFIRERDRSRFLETIRLKDEIRFLKAQINPHFFMNMLNNIHAMIELDSVKAQDMTLELSKLMRYVLYEGENSTSTFVGEISFIESYMALMRRRYPEGKIDISLEVPQHPSADILVPPMIFVTFVENAFKHGVSYQAKSRVCVSLKESDGIIHFTCENTNMCSSKGSQGGVGLDNVRRRLDLMYGDRYTLVVENDRKIFKVSLTIPSL